MISLQLITQGRWIDIKNENIAEVARKGIIQTARECITTPRRIEDETFYNNIVVPATAEMVDHYK